MAGSVTLAWVILAVVVLNALFAFVQEHQAGRAVGALGRYLPPQATVRRDGAVRSVAAVDVVPGDVLVLTEGDRVPADARLLSGDLVLDASALSGESAPVERSAAAVDAAERRLAHDHPGARRGCAVDGPAGVAGEAALRRRRGHGPIPWEYRR